MFSEFLAGVSDITLLLLFLTSSTHLGPTFTLQRNRRCPVLLSWMCFRMLFVLAPVLWAASRPPFPQSDFRHESCVRAAIQGLFSKTWWSLAWPAALLLCWQVSDRANVKGWAHEDKSIFGICRLNLLWYMKMLAAESTTVTYSLSGSASVLGSRGKRLADSLDRCVQSV